MQLPFSFIIEPPTLSELRSASASWLTWTIVGGIVAASSVALFVLRTQVQSGADHDRASVQISSEPAAATITVDGDVLGRTPLDVLVAPGERRVTLRHDGDADASYQLTLTADQTIALHAELWLRVPRVQRLRPIFPGAAIAHASFLNDGRVAISVAFPPGDDRQAWLLDGHAGARRVGLFDSRGALAVSSDGRQVAYLAQGNQARTLSLPNEVWLSGATGEQGVRLFMLPSGASDERLQDLAWAPDGEHLLLVSKQRLTGGGGRTRLRSIDTVRGETRDLLTLPSDVLPGSFVWSSDGAQVAFLTLAGQVTSLCLLRITTRDFHYLADLSRDGTSPLPFPPLAWSPDSQRLVYTAPAQDRPA
ncbi:MAG: PEGA domain-containing protein [Chloroflexi bacterium]|nr:PEGA domain-containing protein [Chloroflexota bacterium]